MDTAQLVEHSQSGDTKAFGSLYNLYAPSMMKVIENYIHIHDVAQDILHDGFIIAYTSLGDLKKRDKFDSWLTTIMRNLSLRYLREEANHISVAMTDTFGEDIYEDESVESTLSWDELNGIIDKLPDGYSKVFRLSVLDGLSHKEIGKMLGIAPHSSSSQLARAKAMLRRLIVEYHGGIGVIGFVAVIFSIIMIWLGINRDNENNDSNLIANKNEGRVKDNMTETTVVRDTIEEETRKPSSKLINNIKLISNDNFAEVKYPKSKLPQDTVPDISDNDNIVKEDTVTSKPKIPTVRDNKLFADNGMTRLRNDGNRWSMSLAYNGNTDQNSDSRYRIPIGPDPDGPDPDGPSDDTQEIEVTEKSRHYMPLTIGLSLNYRLSNRWSIESGIRYTFLRSDFMSESKIECNEINQKIHYIGIPIKFNYHILGNNRFSIYGQGGAALDIPVNGTQSIMKWEQGWDKPNSEIQSISAPLQWSIEGGIGLQYHITPSFGIYVEPSFRYYFNPGTEIKTIRQDKPFEFTIPIGFRLHW